MALNYTCFDILSNLSSGNLVSSKIVCFVMGRASPDSETSLQNVLVNFYTIMEVMTEFIALNTKTSTR